MCVKYADCRVHSRQGVIGPQYSVDGSYVLLSCSLKVPLTDRLIDLRRVGTGDVSYVLLRTVSHPYYDCQSGFSRLRYS